MTKRKKWYRILIVLVFIALGIFCGLRIYQVNAEYGNIPISTYSMKEAVELKNCLVTVTDFQFGEVDSILNAYHVDPESYERQTGEERIGIVTVEVENPTNEIQTLESYLIALRIFNLTLTSDSMKFSLFNSDDQSPFLELEPNEKTEINLPYFFRDVQLADNWKDVDTAPVDCVLQTYPERKVVHVRES